MELIERINVKVVAAGGKETQEVITAGLGGSSFSSFGSSLGINLWDTIESLVVAITRKPR